MTEDEAKTKWCPMVRYSYAGNTGIANNERCNRGEEHGHVNCIGSACMMWRKSNPHWEKCETIHNGYCGLAPLALK